MPLENFTVQGDYALFRPTGPVNMESLLALFGRAMAECRAAGVKKLLINATMLEHTPLTAGLRFTFGAKMAATWDRTIRFALVMRPDQMDSQALGSLVAANRGLLFGTCPTEEAGLEWLRSSAS